jgi:hypothetical protein
MTATYVTECPACGLAGGPFASSTEAEHLAGTHDDLLHRGEPTTLVRPADPPAPPAGQPAVDMVAAARWEGWS